MKNYMAYKQDGQFCGLIPSFDFPEGYDILEDSPTHPMAIDHYNAHTAHPEFAGFVAHDCHCKHFGCNCIAMMTYSHYVDEAGKLCEKPKLVMKIDGVVVPSRVLTHQPDPVAKAPGQPFVLSVEANVPDGTSVTLKLNQARLALTAPVLTFQNGVASCTLSAPAQGMVGNVCNFGSNKLVGPIVCWVVGWTT